MLTDPHREFLINRREERCEDRLAYFLRRLSLDLVASGGAFARARDAARRATR